MDFVAVDGTKIRANTVERLPGNVEEFKKKKKRIEKKIEEILGSIKEESYQGEKHYRG
jgi:Txe/YoeB family toxin of Txe-Axe toxin-antitoxin module